MALVINSNIASITSQRHLSQTRNDMETAMERMSSGRRVNSSMDDAAGLAIANRMTSQVEGLNQAIRNANDAISLAQTAEATLDAHSDILQRMRVLSVQAANDTYSALDRKTLNNEVLQLKEELNRSVSQATFNGQKILDGTNKSFTFQIGHTATDKVTINLANMKGGMIGTQTWADKAGVTAPTATTVASATANKEKDTYTLSAQVGVGGSIAFSYNGKNYVQNYDTNPNITMAALVTKIDAGDATVDASYDSVVPLALVIEAKTASDTQMTPGVVGGTTNGTVAITATKADTQAGNTATPTKKAFDFSAITVVENERVSLTVNGNTYTQAFATDTAATLSALGALVVNGETEYTAKSVSAGVLTLEGGTMGAPTVVIETATVSAAKSVDDILITDSTSAQAALAVVDSALEMMADFRSRMGAMSNRLYHSIDNLMNVSENTAAARSRIEDADFASESANLAKAQVLQQAGTAMLAQANASTKDILSLLK